MAAHDRTESLAAAPELRRRLVAMTGLTGALLGVHLLGSRLDLGATLGLVRTLLAARQLPHHAAVQNVGADGDAEHRIGEIDLTGAGAFDGFDLEFHAQPLSLKPKPTERRPRSPQRPWWRADRPGTAPETSSRPFSSSTETTLRFCVVTRSEP